MVHPCLPAQGQGKTPLHAVGHLDAGRVSLAAPPESSPMHLSWLAHTLLLARPILAVPILAMPIIANAFLAHLALTYSSHAPHQCALLLTASIPQHFPLAIPIMGKNWVVMLDGGQVTSLKVYLLD